MNNDTDHRLVDKLITKPWLNATERRARNALLKHISELRAETETWKAHYAKLANAYDRYCHDRSLPAPPSHEIGPKVET